jgi:hypothetical protein
MTHGILRCTVCRNCGTLFFLPLISIDWPFASRRIAEYVFPEVCRSGHHGYGFIEGLQEALNRAVLGRGEVPTRILHEPCWAHKSGWHRQISERLLDDRML